MARFASFSLLLVYVFSSEYVRMSYGNNYRELLHRVERLENKVTSEMSNKTVPLEGIKPCPPEFYDHPSSLSCYRVMKDTKAWYDARVDCQEQGADLVWFESMVEYRHIVIKLLTDITNDKDYNNAGYWCGANDITGGQYVWGDTGDLVASFFIIKGRPTETQRYSSYSHRKQVDADNSQKHCVFMKYTREQMRIAQETSECDGGRLYICKCKTDRSGPKGCSEPTKKIIKKDD